MQLRALLLHKLLHLPLVDIFHLSPFEPARYVETCFCRLVGQSLVRVNGEISITQINAVFHYVVSLRISLLVKGVFMFKILHALVCFTCSSVSKCHRNVRG